MPRQYPTAFRQGLVDRMLAGESVLSLVAETGVPEQTLHRWKTQGRVDAGLADGVTSTESQALRDAHRRIKELEAEVATLQRLLVDAEVEKAALKEIAEGKW